MMSTIWKVYSSGVAACAVILIVGSIRGNLRLAMNPGFRIAIANLQKIDLDVWRFNFGIYRRMSESLVYRHLLLIATSWIGVFNLIFAFVVGSVPNLIELLSESKSFELKRAQELLMTRGNLSLEQVYVIYLFLRLRKIDEATLKSNLDLRTDFDMNSFSRFKAAFDELKFSNP